MSFPLEKILTISASEYCKMIGRTLEDYTPSGVQFHLYQSDITKKDSLVNVHYSFSINVPTGTEVVVEYRSNTSISDTTPLPNASRHPSISMTAEGTALIPKEKEKYTSKVPPLLGDEF